MPILLDWLQANSPDVLCVQETKVQDDDFPTDAFDNTGYRIVFKGQKKYNGVAILSKSKITDAACHFPNQPDDQARFIKAVVNGVTIVNTYIPQGFEQDSEKFKYKLDWLAKLRDHFAKDYKPEDPIVWVGDLNCAMDARDVHDPDALWGHVCYCQEVQDAINEILDWGFEDLFRKHNQQDKQYTFWDYRAMSYRRNNGWRLDYIMATKPIAKKSKRCWIDKEPRAREKPSDHTFLLAEFDL
jgi:exodeoxyribonuclease-3